MNWQNDYDILDFKDPSYPYIFHKRGHGVFIPHWHDSIEIHCIHTGTGNIVIDSNQYTVKPLDIVCINSLETHWYTTPHQQHYYTLIISPLFVKNCNIDIKNKLLPVLNDPYITQLFEEIKQEDDKQPPYYKTSNKAKIMTLLVHLYRNYTSKDLQFSSTATPPMIVMDILRYIREHYNEDFQIADIGKSIGISTNYLCTCFRRETQITINQYINMLRCNEAKVLLSQGKLSVTEIGTHCGFNSMSYFSKTYRKIIGELPSQTMERVAKKLNTQK